MVTVQVNDDGKIIIGVEYRRSDKVTLVGSTIHIEDAADARTLLTKLPQAIEQAQDKQKRLREVRIAALRKELRELEDGE